MGNTKTPSASWHFLRDSAKLRGVLKYRLEQKDIPFKQIERELGIRQDALSKYFRGVKPNTTDFNLLRLAEYLGIEVRLDIQIKSL